MQSQHFSIKVAMFFDGEYGMMSILKVGSYNNTMFSKGSPMYVLSKHKLKCWGRGGGFYVDFQMQSNCVAILFYKDFTLPINECGKYT